MNIKSTVILLLCLAGLTGCSGDRPAAPEPAVPDLVIYTYQEDGIFSPIIKEYQERTGLTVQVIAGTYKELYEQVQDGTLPAGCDVVFGADAAIFESAPHHFLSYRSPEAGFIAAEFTSPEDMWTAFSVRPLVIMYNTRVVTYRELPDSWNSLLEPRWQGKVAFMEPNLNDTYACALTMAMHSTGISAGYAARLAENIEYTTFDSVSGLNQAIVEGRSFVGVTAEEKAVSLMNQGADIDYVYPKEGIGVLIDGSAVIAGCDNPEQAMAFLDFTISKDVQYFLTSAICRRSVRTDILPPAGLGPQTDFDYTSVTLRDQYEEAITIWNEAFWSVTGERR